MFWRKIKHKAKHKTKHKERSNSFFRSLFLTGCIIFCSFSAAFSQFGSAVSKGILETSPINEASGLVASRENPGFLWTHNDSGDKARIFLIDTLARLRATYYLEGVEARDWEEIAWMQADGANYLIIGDIGDNRAARPNIAVHIIPEPRFSDYADQTSGAIVDTIPATGIQTYKLHYEDGPRDAEAMFYDPLEEQLYIITKRELQVGLYGVKIPQETSEVLPLKRKATLALTFITAADISPGGDEILIKNLLDVYYWKRKPGEPMEHTLSREAIRQPYQPEPQGEAIAFRIDGGGYYTLSEQLFGLQAHLFFAPHKPAISD